MIITCTRNSVPVEDGDSLLYFTVDRTLDPSATISRTSCSSAPRRRRQWAVRVLMRARRLCSPCCAASSLPRTSIDYALACEFACNKQCKPFHVLRLHSDDGIDSFHDQSNLHICKCVLHKSSSTGVLTWTVGGLSRSSISHFVRFKTQAAATSLR